MKMKMKFFFFFFLLFTLFQCIIENDCQKIEGRWSCDDPVCYTGCEASCKPLRCGIGFLINTPIQIRNN